jgi:hypothetical protein
MSSPDVHTLDSAATISGNLHGGQQAIIGATVNLYKTGTTGYGQGSVLLATTKSDANGGFSFTKNPVPSDVVDGTTNAYACPTTGNPVIYLTAFGGNTQGQSPVVTTSGTQTTTVTQSNTASALLAVVDRCSAINSATQVSINELTTVAGAFSLAQYINPGNDNSGTLVPFTESIGTSSSTQGTTGLVNALNTGHNLVGVAEGLQINSANLTGGAAGVTVTMTPETPKVVTIANILAACINSTNGTTTTTVVDSSNSTTTTTTTMSVSNACKDLMAAATPPPSAAVTSQPLATFSKASDTIQAAYYMAVNPIDAGTVASCATTTGATTNIACLYGLVTSNAPFQTGLSAAPTDWTIGINYKSASACSSGIFLNYPTNLAVDVSGNVWVSNTGSANANVSELSPVGAPSQCLLGNVLSTGRGITIDPTGFVWATGNLGTSPYVASVQKIDPLAGTATQYAETGVFPYSIVSDGLGNIFYTDATAKNVHLITGVGTSSIIGSSTGSSPFFMTADTAGRVWVTESSTAGALYEYYPSTGTGSANGYISANVGNTTYTYNDYGIGVGRNNSIYVANSSSRNTLGWATPTTPGAAALAGTTAYTAGISSPRGIAVDGAGNVWAPNGVAASSGLFTVSEFDMSGNPLSPTTTATTAAANTGGFQKPVTVFPNALRGVAIDPSGNVWFGSNSAGTSTIAEIVGAAVPVITPLSLQLMNNTVATKP